MAGKSYWNGILLGVGIALLALAASASLSWLGWIDTSVVSPVSNWLQSQSWMPEFFATLTWFKWLIAGIFGAVIGLWVEYK